jgi:hypothetical protein
VQGIIDQRCVACHAAHPTQPGFATAPAGVMLRRPTLSPERPRIYQQAVQLKAMPLANLTNMTDAERAQVARLVRSRRQIRKSNVHGTTQEKLIAWIDAHFDEQVAFLQEVIRIPTDTPPGNNAPHADAVAEMVRPMAGRPRSTRCRRRRCATTAWRASPT